MRDSPEDERLLDELRRVLDRTDPMPEQVTRAARESYTWRTVDAELAALAWDSDADRPLASVRGTGDARLLTFDAEGLRFDLEISGSGRDRRLVGQLVPAQPGEVELRQRSGLARTVVVVGGEKMTHLATPKVSELIGRSLDPYERSYGTTMPAFAALVTRALMARHGVTEREIAHVAVKNHANGARNPLAQFREPITIDMVLESRMVADPLRLFHCCPISDGAAAVVLTGSRTSVRVAGVGQGTDALALRHRESLTSFRATQAAASAAFAMAGFGPERVDVAEIHDAFAPFELISLEDIGLFPPGKAGPATLDGETALEGRLPINPSGGLKARGHPLAATGIAQIVECVWQLTGRAPTRQVGCSVALAQSIGGPGTNNWVTILESR